MKDAKRLAVFAHWDGDCVVDDYVLLYLDALSKLCDIVFVSDCELPAAELKKVEPFTIARIAEVHGEYDFGSYKKGYLHAFDMLETYDELVFANDSCYGPFAPFEQMWETMASRDCDFWGMFENCVPGGHHWHVQSYFLVFRQAVHRSPAFDAFIRGVRAQPTKMQVVIQYELGLSTALRGAGFRSSSLIPRNEDNLTFKRDAFALVEQGAPLLKKSLLTTNPLKSPWLIKPLQAWDAKLKEGPLLRAMAANLQRTAPRGYKCHWFYANIAEGHLFHPKFLRYKEKSMRWASYLSIKIAGMTMLYLPWKINFRRICHDIDGLRGKHDSPLFK